MPAKNNVIDGIRQVSTALKEGRLRICRSCSDCRREFGLYRWESSGRDAPRKEDDHAMDDVRYFTATYLTGSGDEIFAVALDRKEVIY